MLSILQYSVKLKIESIRIDNTVGIPTRRNLFDNTDKYLIIADLLSACTVILKTTL